MSAPEVKIQFVAGGVDNILKGLKTVEGALQNSALRERQIKETNLQKIKELEEKKLAKVKEINDKEVLSDQDKANKIKHIEENVSNSIRTIKEREALRIHQIQERAAQRQIDNERKLTSRLQDEHNKRNHQLTSSMQSKGMSNISPTGSNIAGSFSEAGGSLMAMGGEAVGLSAIGGGAIVAAVAAGYVIKKSFDILVDGIKFAASEFSSAILEIGGGMSVSAAIVKGQKARQQASRLAANIPDVSERMSADEITATSMQIATNTPFDYEDVVKGFQAFNELTGKAKSFATVAPELMKIAKVGGLSAEEIARVYGQLQAQFPGMSADQTVAATRNLLKLGQVGSVELKNVQNIAQVTDFARVVSPDKVRGIGMMGGMVQLIKPHTGGAEEAVTGLKNLNEELLTSHRLDVEQMLGHKITTKNKEGDTVFKDYKKTIAELALLNITNPELVQGTIPEKRALRAIRGVGVSAEELFTPGMSKAEKLRITEEMLDKYFNLTKTSGELQEEYNISINNSTDQMKISFDKLKNTIDGISDPLVREVLPKIQEFVKAIGEHSPEIAAASQVLLDSINVIIDIFGLLAPSIEGSIKAILGISDAIIKGMDEATMHLFPGLHGLSEDLTKLRNEINKTPAQRQAEKADNSFHTLNPDFIGPPTKDASKAALILEQGGGLKNISYEAKQEAYLSAHSDLIGPPKKSDVEDWFNDSFKKSMTDSGKDFGKAAADTMKELLNSSPNLPNRSVEPINSSGRTAQ